MTSWDDLKWAFIESLDWWDRRQSFWVKQPDVEGLCPMYMLSDFYMSWGSEKKRHMKLSNIKLDKFLEANPIMKFRT